MGRQFGMFLAGSLAIAVAIPCGGVYRKGEEATITSESAVIVFEQESQTETFIRTATFSGKGGDFGFIVPTPTEPDLSEVDGTIFREAGQILARRFPSPRGSSGKPGGGGFGGGGAPQVEVVKTQTLAGMKATVLKAQDSRSLMRWLDDNGYPASVQIMDWVRYYVDQNYYLTAFKLERKLETDQVHSANVKMVFRSKIPFYPYREPSYPRDPRVPRSLHVYFFGPYVARARYMNTNIRWEAESKPVTDLTQEEADRVMKAAKLEPSIFPVVANMTYFLDTAKVRRDWDVVFVPKD